MADGTPREPLNRRNVDIIVNPNEELIDEFMKGVNYSLLTSIGSNYRIQVIEKIIGVRNRKNIF